MDDTRHTLCHVTTPQAVAAAGDRLTGYPFLHCCTDAQLAFVLERHFPGRTGLLVLRFDPATVDGRIEWERSEPDQPPFPHLYGALPLATVATEQL
ncbi:DUF952 domain-containing protein [Acidisphaera sp. L21]|jgi:uncharacterized protein (DUF952 family)|uniref:DUF952 domain-containing protein n=1 Tax=Acidisphaera sp. L21 TaxID=1641851 RepID=UPI00131B1381|nr:DUF952 domain-containing protein [Acidisphaera sp. L21]